MAQFDADKLNQRLEQLNREQLATMEKLVQELLNDMQRNRPDPDRSDQLRFSPGSE